MAIKRIRKQIRGINLSDIIMDLFEKPIKSKKVRDGLYAHQHRNGYVNIDGQKYYGFSMTGAIYQYRLKFPKYPKS